MLQVTPGPTTSLWKDLTADAARLSAVPTSELFSRDPGRFERFSRNAIGLQMDYSRQRLDEVTLAKLIAGLLNPIAGVILTNGEIDAVAGLLSMREGWPFTIYAHERVLSILRTNSIFNVLSEKNVKRQPIGVDQAFEPSLPDGSPSGIEVLPFAVPGKGAWYLEGKAHPAGDDGIGDTLGLRIADKSSGRHFYFLAACANVTDDLKSRLVGASAIFFDGTVWRDDELIAAGLGNKTGQGMGHIAMSGDRGAIESLAGLDIDRKMFLHINNSNPVLLHDSAERTAAERAGWQIPADGTEITL